MKYSDEQRLSKIIEKTEALLLYIEKNGITEDIISSEEPVQWAITTPLYNIGEHAYNLSQSFKETHPEIPWMKISGMRHRLVHDYFETMNKADSEPLCFYYAYIDTQSKTLKVWKNIPGYSPWEISIA